ncbi:3-oxoadipate enol-lactonase [Solimonas variicoloris]|uniref:3-oxoadipate enol-lactonase n=1 Tax=Solimonas variicoloris TaxID=254408 RepID=UPI00037651E2|nr:3-oxoadipate enol-lactonase [Solimonas variicoloris]
MPALTIEGLRLHYRLEGRAEAPILVLSNSLGTSLSMWDAQMPALTPHFRVLRYDMRGHGASDVPAGEYRVDELGHDVLRLLDAVGCERAHFCGLSIGGLIGQWLALHAPQRLDRLVLCNTAARIAQPDVWDARIALVREKGMAEIASGAITRWFTPAFVARATAAVEAVREQLLATSPTGYIGGVAAVRDADFRTALPTIRGPALVIAGSEDRTTTVADGRRLAEAIGDARLVTLPAAHLSNIEAQADFDAALLAFLRG